MMDIGTRLAQLRKKHGYSQKKVATALDMTQANYSKIESDLRTPKETTLRKAADLYDISLDELKKGNAGLSYFQSTEVEMIKAKEEANNLRAELAAEKGASALKDEIIVLLKQKIGDLQDEGKIRA